MNTQQETLLTLFDALAWRERTSLSARIKAAGLPESILPQVEAGVETALAGVRLALMRWTPRPPLQSEAEVDAFTETLADEITARVNEVLGEWYTKLAVAASRSQAAFIAWNRERHVTQDKMTPQARAAMSEPKAEDTEHFERVDLGGGKFHFRYAVKPDKTERTDR